MEGVLSRFNTFESSTMADLQATLQKLSDLQEQFMAMKQQMLMGGGVTGIANGGMSANASGLLNAAS